MEGEWLDSTHKLISLDKIQVVYEGKESEKFIEQLKPILSHDDIEVKIPVVTKVKNKNTTIYTIVRGWVPWFFISAKKLIDLESSSRAWVTEPYANPDKYKEAIKSQALRKSRPWDYTDDDVRLKPFKIALSKLKKYRVWNPFTELIEQDLPYNAPDTMRLSKQLWSAIESRTILYQFQREKVTINDHEYLVATYDDVVNAINDCIEMIKTSKFGLQTHQVKFHEDVMIALSNDVEPDRIEERKLNITYDKIQAKFKAVYKYRIPRSTLKRNYIDPSLEYGLLELDDSKKPYVFKVKELSNAEPDPTSTTLTNFYQAQPTKIFPKLEPAYAKRWLDENMSEKMIEYGINHQTLGLHIDIME